MDQPHAPADATTERAAPGRGVLLVAVAVLGLALIGFVVGLRQGATVYVPGEPPPRMAPAASGNAVPALAYAAFDRRSHGINRAWKSHLNDLAQPTPDLFATVTWDAATRAQQQAKRAQRRAHPGAPPVVPHPVDQLSSASCVACHLAGITIGPVRAPAMSHGLLPSCTQCHVEAEARHVPALDFVDNSFEPFARPALAPRAWHAAPPIVPHPTFMRENCTSCHGPFGAEPLRTSHPWRASCLQCHAPSATLDQAPFDARAPFLPLETGADR